MAGFTKNAIKEAFLQLLEERPYSKITVRDIVERCGINRNSFYYHFHDIPSLMEEIVRDETTRIIERYPTIDSMERGLNVTIEFALQHRRAVMHLYKSIRRDIYEQHLWTLCDYVVRSYFDSAFPEARISDNDREILIRYYKCLCFGVSIDWLENDMQDDIHEKILRLAELKRGQTEWMLSRCDPAEDGRSTE